MSDKCLPTKSDYRSDGKYKVVGFQNGLGETWFQIQTQGWFFKRWFRCWYNTEYGWTPYVPTFQSEEEAVGFLKKEQDDLLTEQKRRKVTIIESGTRRGFTLTEVLVVIFVLVSLGGLLVPAIQAARENAKNLRENQNPEEANKNGWYMSTVRHDGHLWVMNRTMDYFLHHPDCPCKGKAEKE